MRSAFAAAISAVLLTGCGSVTTTVATPHSPDACTRGWSASNPSVQLTNADNQRTIAVSLCDSIDISLLGPPNGAQWNFPETSDARVVQVVPLPLPHPANGGVDAVYFARRTGTATLSAGSMDPQCPANAYCAMLPAWSVTVTVTPP